MQQQQDEMNELRDPVKRTASCCPSSSSSSSFLTAHATGGCHCGQAKTSTKKAYLCTGYLQLPATLHQFPALFQILDRVWQLVGTGSGKRLCGSGCHITVKPKVYFVFFFLRTYSLSKFTQIRKIHSCPISALFPSKSICTLKIHLWMPCDPPIK